MVFCRHQWLKARRSWFVFQLLQSRTGRRTASVRAPRSLHAPLTGRGSLEVGARGRLHGGACGGGSRPQVGGRRYRSFLPVPAVASRIAPGLHCLSWPPSWSRECPSPPVWGAPALSLALQTAFFPAAGPVAQGCSAASKCQTSTIQSLRHCGGSACEHRYMRGEAAHGPRPLLPRFSWSVPP